MLTSIRNYLFPQKNDPDEELRREIVRVLSLGLLILSLLAFAFLGLFVLLGPSQMRNGENLLTLAIAVITALLAFGIYKLNQRTSRLSSILLLLLLIYLPGRKISRKYLRVHKYYYPAMKNPWPICWELQVPILQTFFFAKDLALHHIYFALSFLL